MPRPSASWQRTAARLQRLGAFVLLRPMVTCAFAGLLSVVTGFWLHQTGSLDSAQRVLTEMRFAAAVRPASGQIVFLDIDQQTLQQVGVWPWPRRIHAEIIDRLNNLGAAEVMLDIDFSQRSNPADDAALAEALSASRAPVSLASFSGRDAISGHAGRAGNMPLPEFLGAALPASVSMPVMSDGRIWQARFAEEIGGETVLSASALLSGVAGPASRLFGIDFSIDAGTVPRYPVASLLAGTLAADAISGRKVVVAASAQELRDIFAVPAQGLLPGGLVQVIAAETLLQNRVIQHCFAMPLLFAMVALGGALTFAGLTSWHVRVSVFACASVLIELAALELLKQQGISPETVPAQMALAIMSLSVLLRELSLRRMQLAIVRASRENERIVLEQVFSESFDGLVLVGPDGLVRNASRRAEEVLGRELPPGSNAADVLPPALFLAVAAELEHLDGGGSVQLHEATLEVEEGQTRIVEFVVTRSRILSEDAGREGEVAGYLACLTCRDISQRRRAEQIALYLGTHDVASGLPNRSAIEAALDRILHEGAAGDAGCSVIMVSLEGAEMLTASLGERFLDQMRQSAARRLRQLPAAILGVAGDSRFVLVLTGGGMRREAAICEDLRRLLEEPFDLQGNRVRTGIALGIARSSGRGITGQRLLQQAGTALSLARKEGSGSCRVFDMDMQIAVDRRRQLELDMRAGLEEGQFRVLYQPIVRLADGVIAGVEALVRWRHPVLGHVSPAEFIPIAEESGLINDLGAHVIKAACADVVCWPGSIRLAVNVSARQIANGSLLTALQDAIANSGMAASRIDLELVESLFLTPDAAAQKALRDLLALGCRLALDDFGTGYSALGYITTFPFSKLKIDKSFVDRLTVDPRQVAMVKGIIDLARPFGMTVVAEGVEEAAQASILRELGCDLGQGYLFARPQMAAEVAAMLADRAA